MNVVERVARAINRAQCVDDADAAETWSHENVRHNRMIDARAAIEAMRNPTMQMAEAGYCPHLKGSPLRPDRSESLAALKRWWTRLSPEDIWPAMIDAALDEKD